LNLNLLNVVSYEVIYALLLKIRLRNSANNKGKSAGYRVVTYTKIKDSLILVYIYSKSNEESVSTQKIDDIISNYKSE